MSFHKPEFNITFTLLTYILNFYKLAVNECTDVLNKLNSE